MSLRRGVLALATLAATFGLAGCGGTTEVVVGGPPAEVAAPEVLDVDAAVRATAALPSVSFDVAASSRGFWIEGEGAADLVTGTGWMDLRMLGMATTVVLDGTTAYLRVPAMFGDGADARWVSHALDSSGGANALLPWLDGVDDQVGSFTRVGRTELGGVELTEWQLQRAPVEPAVAPVAPEGFALPGLDLLGSLAATGDVRVWTAVDGSIRRLLAEGDDGSVDLQVSEVGLPVTVVTPDPALVSPFPGLR